MVLGMCFCVAALSFAANGWKRYTFDDLKFAVNCPAGWDVRKLDTGVAGELVTVILPKNTTRSGFRGTMVFVSSPADGSMTLEGRYERNIREMAGSSDFPGFKQLDSYKINLSGVDAYQTTLTYSHPKLKVKLKSFQIYLMKSGRLYVIQYAAPALTYKKFMDDVNEIVRSFAPMQ